LVVFGQTDNANYIFRGSAKSWKQINEFQARLSDDSTEIINASLTTGVPMLSSTDTKIAILVLLDEIEHYKTLIQEHGTGHIYTTIGFLERRVQELKNTLETLT
tara:strand:+ start:387 stop:698 length:312 start_codon:yes stop_codon:yes gene_type:complete